MKKTLILFLWLTVFSLSFVHAWTCEDFAWAQLISPDWTFLGYLDANEFNEATKEKKGFLGIDFKDPKTILAIVGIAITVIGIIIGLCVWLSRRNKKKKEEQEKLKVDQQLKSGNINMSVSSGNSAEQVHAPISTDMQQQSNDAFNQYTPSPINNGQQPLNLNDSHKSMDMGR